MPLSTVAKAALCVCPPALMAGTVATVPPVKRAVHHLTARPAATKAVRRVPAAAAARPAALADRPVDCAPGGGGPLPAVPLVTYADPIPDEPGGIGGSGLPGGVPVIGGIGLGGGGGGGGTVPVVPGGPDVPGAGPVPEPSVWMMMILGVGTLGAGLRRRRMTATATAMRGGRRGARRAVAGGALWSGSAAVEAGDMAATVAMKSAVASAAGKAMLCVCPAAIVAGTVMTVPPLRQAVHAATVVPDAAPSLAAFVAPIVQPCLEPLTVAATAIEGFPAAVQPASVTAVAATPAPTSAPAPAALPAPAIASATTLPPDA